MTVAHTILNMQAVLTNLKTMVRNFEVQKKYTKVQGGYNSMRWLALLLCCCVACWLLLVVVVVGWCRILMCLDLEEA